MYALLYALAIIVASIVIFLAFSSDHPAEHVGSLVALAGVFVAIAAGVQELDKRRNERQQVREQSERDSLRRFDERFAAVTAGTGSNSPAMAAGASAELMTFLRKEDKAFHKQTYFYALAHLKMSESTTCIDRIFFHAFECAAQFVLPDLLPEIRRCALDFSGAQLTGVDLTELELAEADLSGTILTEANLSGSCLWRAHGAGTDLSNSSLRHANLEEALLTRLNATGADFSFSNLVAARFAPKHQYGNAVLRKAQFVGARMQGACFNGANLCDARFDGANLRGASFRGVTWNESMLRSVVRAANRTWEKAYWDPVVCRKLNFLAHNCGVVKLPRRRPSDHAKANYRCHPFPHHPDTLRRPPYAGLR
ncbi:pentapeptide repeat-containing protein [Streptosporangium amethystogenes]|uniref:pentapeptide repeat-containing protein n=1 Tax=Streptosporangium amethystogenes TaxID=2002 RepID=UPI0037B6DDDE